jgi:hypothetical protein
MEESFSNSSPPEAGDDTPLGDGNGSDTIVIGPSERSLIAAGRGARVIYQEAITKADEARAQASYEREQLAGALARRASELDAQVTAPQPGGSVYPYLLPYDLADAGRFFGRQAELAALLENLICPGSRCRLLVLSGEAGLGKTSLVQAGLQPALVADEHLPLLVRVAGTADLSAAIKRSLLDDLNSLPGLKEASLKRFARDLAGLLPHGKRLFVLLDQFESFLEQPPELRQHFLEELAECLADPNGRAHWLLSVRASHLARLSSFQPSIPQPFANLVVLPGLSRAAAKSAILEPARQRGLEVDDDLLKALLTDLGKEDIDPTRLQLICHELVERLPAGENHLRLAAYQQSGGVGQVARRYLEGVLEQNIPAEDRPEAWNLLAALARRTTRAATLVELKAELAPYPGLRPREAGRVLGLLENQRLVRRSDERYLLASEDFLPSLHRWEMERAVREKARQETVRQLQSVRNSALRGLLGGALGFSLAFLLTYASQIFDRSLLPYLAALRAIPGGMAGLVFVLFVDLGLASYRGARRPGLWLTATLAGAGGFMLALLVNALLRSVQGIAALSLVALEGAAWGAAAGLGAAWAITSRRPAWQTLPGVAILCGLVLALLDPIGAAFGQPGAIWQVFLAGAVFPLFVVAAAWLGGGSRWDMEDLS